MKAQLGIKARYIVVAGTILAIASFNLVRSGKDAVSSLYFILKNPLSYDQKMSMKYGHEYDFLKFVNDSTPSNAVIMHPPKVKPWLTVGNQGLIQYFLYPRKLLSEDRKRVEFDKTITHILVAWGEGKVKDPRMYGWPKFPVNIRKFMYLPRKREVFVDSLGVDFSSLGVHSKVSRKNPEHLALLKNYISDSEKKVNDHQLVELNNRLIERIDLTYTSGNYDYWTKAVGIPLVSNLLVKAKVRANIRHSVNLIAEVKYNNGKLTIFSSSPNKEEASWELLSIGDLYERAKKYARLRGWNTEKMVITKIGVNTGLPLEVPYLEKYGVVELERGQERREGEINIKIENAPLFLSRGNFYRAKDQIKEAIQNYRLAEELSPADAWIHCNLGDMYKQKGKLTKAITEYKKAIQFEPGSPWFYFALGEVYQTKNRIDLAMDSFERVVELDSSSIWAHITLGDIYLEKGEYEEAYVHFKTGARHSTYSADSRYALEALRNLNKRLAEGN